MAPVTQLKVCWNEGINLYVLKHLSNSEDKNLRVVYVHEQDLNKYMSRIPHESHSLVVPCF